jgi:hypothetical protein
MRKAGREGHCFPMKRAQQEQGKPDVAPAWAAAQADGKGERRERGRRQHNHCSPGVGAYIPACCAVKIPLDQAAES